MTTRKFPADTDFVSMAALVTQVVQHAEWARGPLQIPRDAALSWSALQRFAALLSQHGFVRAANSTDCLSLSPSPALATLLLPQAAEGALLREALVSSVRQRDDAECRALLERMSVQLATGPGR